MWPIVQVRYEKNMILNIEDRLDSVWSMLKMKDDNKVTDRKRVISTKDDTKLSRPIG